MINHIIVLYNYYLSNPIIEVRNTVFCQLGEVDTGDAVRHELNVSDSFSTAEMHKKNASM